MGNELERAKSRRCSSFFPQAQSSISQLIKYTLDITPMKSSVYLQVCLRCPSYALLTLHMHFPHLSTCHNILQFPIYLSVTSPVCKLYEGKDRSQTERQASLLCFRPARSSTSLTAPVGPLLLPMKHIPPGLPVSPSVAPPSPH